MFLVSIPFSVYFGWISVATIANATVLFVDLGWNGFGIPEAIWTAAVMAVGALIAVHNNDNKKGCCLRTRIHMGLRRNTSKAYF